MALNAVVSVTGTGHWPRFDRFVSAPLKIGAFVRRSYRRIHAKRGPVPANGPVYLNALVSEVPSLRPDRSPPLVTVIILNHNGAEMLDSLLSSVKRINTYPRLEIIVVDHASSDTSVVVARKWAEELPIVVILSPENYSFAYSCNRAAERSAGEYLFFLNNDIVLVDDVIGPLMASVRQHHGLAGCKLIKDSNGAHPIVHHIGVRFQWNIRHRLSAPYEATPTSRDERIAHNPARFFAVTGAALMCSRDSYLAVGGMCEEYYYGFEDVDFCLKMALGYDRPSICYNNLILFHHAGTTRKAIFSTKDQRRILNDNVAVLKRRFGYGIKRTIWPLLFTDDGSIWGRSPRIVLAVSDSEVRRSLADAFRRSRNWDPCTDDVYHLTRCDLLIVADPDYRMNHVKRYHPMMIRVAWIIEDASKWSHHDFSIFDLVVADDVATARRAETITGTAVGIVHPASRGATDTLVSLIEDRLKSRHRFSIKLSSLADLKFAMALATELRLKGHSVRIDTPDLWACRDGMRDDVVLFLRCSQDNAPSEIIAGKISIACGGSVGGVDVYLPLDEISELANAVTSAVNFKHKERILWPERRTSEKCLRSGCRLHDWNALDC